MKIFSGSSNRPLALKLALKLGLKLAKVELSQFPNAEVRVWVREKVSRHKVVILQSLAGLCPERYLIELCLLADALKRKGAVRITAVVPWLAYTKQDKVFRPGEPLSAEVVAKIIQSVPIDSLITFDLHSRRIADFFKIPLIHLSALPVLERRLKKEVSPESMVVSIGKGGAGLSKKLAEGLNLPVVYLETERDLKTGRVTVKNLTGEVRGRDILIIDDMIATGSTILKASAFLKRRGARKITVAASHHLFIPEVSEKLEKSPINQLYVTDTVKKPEKLKLKKTKIVSIAPLVAENIK